MAKKSIYQLFIILVLWIVSMSGLSHPEEISLKLIAEPSTYEGECPATITFRGRIISSGPCRAQYQFVRSDGGSSSIKEEVFDKAGWKDVSMTWTIGKDYSGWVSLKVISPQQIESEKAFFKITCKERVRPVGTAIPKTTVKAPPKKVIGKPTVQPQEKEPPGRPQAKAIPIVSYQDPNEPSIPDNKDFKDVKISYQEEKDWLVIKIDTYESFLVGTFSLLFNTDDDDAAEIAITCLQTSFKVARETTPGLFNDVIFQGKPTVSGSSYSIGIPWSGILGNQDVIRFWIYSPESQDRLPDSGTLHFDRSSYKLAPLIDKDKDGIDDSKEEELLKRFRPYYKFSEKSGKKENYRPTDAVYQMRWAQLKNDDWPPAREPDTVKSCGDPNESYHISPPNRILECLDGKLDILRNPDKTSYYLNISDSHREGSNWIEARTQAPGLYGHVVKSENLIKIEYWQFFGYSGQDGGGDHEGDWCTVQLFYDPNTNNLVKTAHWAHGKGMAFDLGQTRNIVELGDNFVEHRGTNYDSDPGSLHWDYRGAREQPRYPPPFQNNTLRFYKGNGDLHVVVYVERDAHEFWPTEHGSWPAANEHNGQGPSYLVPYVPEKMNLGEIKNPLSDSAKIVLRYNGYWGCYHHIGNNPPPGPTLHCQWTFPENEKDLEDKLKSRCEH